MPILGTQKMSGGSTGGSASYTTASVSPTSGVFNLLAIGNASAGTATIPTVSGSGVTWDQVTTVPNAANTRRITVFRALNYAPGSGALTVDFGGVSQSSCQWSLAEFNGTDITGSNGSNVVVQTASDLGTSVTSGTATLGTFNNTANATVGVVLVNGGPAITPGSGFTELGEITATLTLETEYKNSNDTTVDFSWTGAQNCISLGLELLASTQGGFFLELI